MRLIARQAQSNDSPDEGGAFALRFLTLPLVPFLPFVPLSMFIELQREWTPLLVAIATRNAQVVAALLTCSRGLIDLGLVNKVCVCVRDIGGGWAAAALLPPACLVFLLM